MNTRGGDARVALPHPEAYNLPIVAFPSCVQREAKLLEDGLPKMLSLDSAVPGLLHRSSRYFLFRRHESTPEAANKLASMLIPWR